MSSQEKVKSALIELGGRGRLSDITKRLIDKRELEGEIPLNAPNVLVRLRSLEKWGEVEGVKNKSGKIIEWQIKEILGEELEKEYAVTIQKTVLGNRVFDFLKAVEQFA